MRSPKTSATIQSFGSLDSSAPLPRYRSSYSRIVWFLKYALPVIAGFVVVLVVFWPEFGQQPEKFRIPTSDIRMQTTGGQRVTNAIFTGVDKDNRPFSVTAKGLIQKADGAKSVELTEPKADIMLENDSWVIIAAPQGTFWRKHGLLDLVGGVKVFHDSGYEFRTAKASIDLKNRNASGDTLVIAQGPYGKINSQGFKVIDNGSRVIFTGKARLLIFSTALRQDETHD